MIKKLLLFFLFVSPFYVGFAQFTENFDAGATIPTGWTVINGGDANTWTIIDFSVGNTGAHSGANVVGIEYGSSAHDDYLVTPAITVTAGVSDHLSFWGRSRDPQYPEVISVRLSTTGIAPADFTITLDSNVAPTSGTNFYQYQYDLSAYVGQTVYIGFYSDTTDMFYFDIDDVSVGTSLATEAFDDKALSFYPNPIKNNFHVSYSSEIQSVQVFNLLGQKVLHKDLNLSQTILDMSNLNSETYWVKIYVGNHIETIKVLKE